MRNKRLTILNITSLTLVGLLVSCGKIDPEKKPEEKPVATEKIIFTSFFHGGGINDCALTIKALENEDLTNITLNLSGVKGLIKSLDFGDNKVLKKDKVLVVANKDFSKKEQVESDKLILLDDNNLRNFYSYSLVNENDAVIDRLGTEGLSLDLAYEETLVRFKEKYTPNPKYRNLDYVKVSNKENEFIFENYLTYDDFIKGPTLNEELYGDRPFVALDNITTGTGGYTKVNLASLGDGDTTQFNWPSPYDDIFNGYKHRVRYLLINTPEIDHGPSSHIKEEPFGKEAQKFNNDKLRNASIIVQSNDEGAVRDTYERTLGFVWYTNVSNPKLSDYRLLNYEIVKEGLANIDFSSDSTKLYSKNGITYSNYIRYGFQLASEMNLNIHSK